MVVALEEGREDPAGIAAGSSTSITTARAGAGRAVGSGTVVAALVIILRGSGAAGT
jgi:hypothetical protein